MDHSPSGITPDTKKDRLKIIIIFKKKNTFDLTHLNVKKKKQGKEIRRP